MEFTSLSKTYAMPGWRMGFAVGNERLIAALARVKSYLDYGAFTPIQVAAAAALNGPIRDCVDEIRQIYRTRRKDCLVESLDPRSGWADSRRRRPRCLLGRRFPNSFRGSCRFFGIFKAAAREGARRGISPGIGFGEYGEGFVRIALVENEQRIRQAARNIKTVSRFGGNGTPQPPPQYRRHYRQERCVHTMSEPLKLGIAGLGTVGIGVLKLLDDNADVLSRRCNRPLQVTAVSARDRNRDRGVDLGNCHWFEDCIDLARSPDIDIFVELIGGEDGPAKQAVEAALAAGHHVVTANKALLACHGTELARLAEANGAALNYEAAIAGGIPIVKTMRERLRRQPGADGLRHPERHLQLHPDPYGDARVASSSMWTF